MGREVIVPACSCPSLSQALTASAARLTRWNGLEMSEQYYVYAFDITDKMVTAALSCPDEKTAKRAYQHARREMELQHGSVDSIIVGYATLTHGGSIQIEYPAGWYAKENRYWMEY